MRLEAAASSTLRSALAGPARSATWLGVTPAALYLQVTGTPVVVGLLTHDAVRLPCAVLLPARAAELPLTGLASSDTAGDATIGNHRLAWAGPAGRVVVEAVRDWTPARVRSGGVPPAAFAALAGDLPAPATLGIDRALLTTLTTDAAAAVGALLGRGPGLTPAGDDVLAGYLLGARAIGLDTEPVRAAVAAMARARTTALSATLLWHAARGECVDEVAAVVADPTGPALRRLLTVGHTSGAALAIGLATASSAALRAGLVGEAA